MKKLLIGLVLLLTTSFVFANVWENAEQIIEKFWNEGKVIKIVKDENNITYLNKSFVQYISIDEDELEIQCYQTQKHAIGLGSWSSDNLIEFKVEKCDIYSDKDGNIIINTKK